MKILFNILPLIAVSAVMLLTTDAAIAQDVSTLDMPVRTSVNPLDYSGPAWSPYVVGGLIGVLSMLTFYFANKALGASSAYASVTGIMARQIAPEQVKATRYYQDNPPQVNWGVMLVVGIMLGAFIAAWSGGELTGQFLPAMWRERFGGASHGLRALVALGGGLLMAFGARMAGGCTSGHGISGTLQLSIGSWIAAICFFAGGILTAFLLYG